MASKTAPSFLDCKKISITPFVETIYNNLCNKLNLHREEIPKVSVGPFNRGDELFGSQRDKKVMLHDREEPSKIKLLQFDPYIFLLRLCAVLTDVPNFKKKRRKHQGLNGIFFFPKALQAVKVDLWTTPI